MEGVVIETSRELEEAVRKVAGQEWNRWIRGIRNDWLRIVFHVSQASVSLKRFCARMKRYERKREHAKLFHQQQCLLIAEFQMVSAMHLLAGKVYKGDEVAERKAAAEAGGLNVATARDLLWDVMAGIARGSVTGAYKADIIAANLFSAIWRVKLELEAVNDQLALAQTANLGGEE